MHPNERLISSFYEAFARRDADAMAACYHPDATFRDPVFTDLRGAQVPAMWRMLAGRAQDLDVRHRDVRADERAASAHWDASYTFTQTGRRVVNHIDARFDLRDGLIARHVDAFDLYAWTRQALGPTGVLLGWTPMVQGRVRAQAKRSLEKFMASSPRTG